MTLTIAELRPLHRCKPRIHLVELMLHIKFYLLWTFPTTAKFEVGAQAVGTEDYKNISILPIPFQYPVLFSYY